MVSRCVPLLGQRLIEWPTSHQCESRNDELPRDSIPHSFSDPNQLAGGAHVDVAINAPGQFRGQGSTSTWTHGEGVASPGQHDAHHSHMLGDAQGWVRLPSDRWFQGILPEPSLVWCPV